MPVCEVKEIVKISKEISKRIDHKTLEDGIVMKELEKELLPLNDNESISKKYDIVPISGKGMGIVAKHFIKRGELIIKEGPILRFLASISYDWEQFNKLSLLQLDQILKLDKCPTNNRKSQYERFREIMKKHASKVSDSPPEQKLFKDISMLNHSCIPNAETYFVDPYMRVYAIQDIGKDEEICVAYVDMRIYSVPPTINVVQYHSRMAYEFVCNCKLCGNSDKNMREEIEKHRISYWQLFKDSRKQQISKKMAKRLVKLPSRYEKDQARIEVEFCEKLLQQMNKAKQFSMRDTLAYAMNGLSVIMAHHSWSLLLVSSTEIKQKARYFYQIAEEALLICEGSDGPITNMKRTLDSYKAYC